MPNQQAPTPPAATEPNEHIHDFTGQEDGSWRCSCGFDRDCPDCAKWKEAGASWPRPCKEHLAIFWGNGE